MNDDYDSEDDAFKPDSDYGSEPEYDSDVLESLNLSNLKEIITVKKTKKQKQKQNQNQDDDEDNHKKKYNEDGHEIIHEYTTEEEFITTSDDDDEYNEEDNSTINDDNDDLLLNSPIPYNINKSKSTKSTKTKTTKTKSKSKSKSKSKPKINEDKPIKKRKRKNGKYVENERLNKIFKKAETIRYKYNGPTLNQNEIIKLKHESKEKELKRIESKQNRMNRIESMGEPKYEIKPNKNPYPEHSVGYLDYEKEVLERIRLGGKDLELRTGFIPMAPRVPNFYSEKTDLCCLWCTEPIHGYPIPKVHRFKSRFEGYEITGQYCTYGCVTAATLQHNGSLMALGRMLKHFYGKRSGSFMDDGSINYPPGVKGRNHQQLINPLIPAPPKDALIKFGGHMTIEEFRGTSLRGILVQKVHVPMLPIVYGFEEQFISESSCYSLGIYQERLYKANKAYSKLNKKSKDRIRKNSSTKLNNNNITKTKRRKVKQLANIPKVYSDVNNIDEQIKIANEQSNVEKAQLLVGAGLISMKDYKTNPTKSADEILQEIQHEKENQQQLNINQPEKKKKRKMNLMDFMKPQ